MPPARGRRQAGRPGPPGCDRGEPHTMSVPDAAPLARVTRGSDDMRLFGYCLTALLGAGCAHAAPEKPVTTEAATFRVTQVAGGLANPWCVAFLPDGDLLVTERPGRLRLVHEGRLRAAPGAGGGWPAGAGSGRSRSRACPRSSRGARAASSTWPPIPTSRGTAPSTCPM